MIAPAKPYRGSKKEAAARRAHLIKRATPRNGYESQKGRKRLLTLDAKTPGTYALVAVRNGVGVVYEIGSLANCLSARHEIEREVNNNLAADLEDVRAFLAFKVYPVDEITLCLNQSF